MWNSRKVEARQKRRERDLLALFRPAAARRKPPDDFLGANTRRAVGGNASVAMSLREPLAVRPYDKRHVAVGNLALRAKRASDENLRGRRRKQIVAPNDLSNAHRDVVHRAGKRIARAKFVTRKREVAKRRGDILLEAPRKDIVERDARAIGDAEPPAGDAGSGGVGEWRSEGVGEWRS